MAKDFTLSVGNNGDLYGFNLANGYGQITPPIWEGNSTWTYQYFETNAVENITVSLSFGEKVENFDSLTLTIDNNNYLFTYNSDITRYEILSTELSTYIVNNSGNNLIFTVQEFIDPVTGVTDLEASDNEINKVIINWTPDPNAEQEDLYKNDLLYQENISSPFEDVNVNPGTINNYYIISSNFISSAESNHDDGMAIGEPPQQITDLTASTDIPYEIHLSWSILDDDAIYEIYRDSVLISSVESGINNYIDDSVYPNQNYYYHLKAKNSWGETLSNTVYGVAVLPLPSQITDFQASDTLCSSIQINFTPLDTIEFATYDLYLDDTLWQSNVNPNDTFTLRDYDEHIYFIRATNSAGSTDSNTDTGIAIFCPPQDITDFQASDNIDSRIVCTWTTPFDADSVDLYRDGNLFSENVTSPYTDTNIETGVVYTYFVRAHNADGFTDSNSDTGEALSGSFIMSELYVKNESDIEYTRLPHFCGVFVNGYEPDFVFVNKDQKDYLVWRNKELIFNYPFTQYDWNEKNYDTLNEINIIHDSGNLSMYATIVSGVLKNITGYIEISTNPGGSLVYYDGDLKEFVQVDTTSNVTRLDDPNIGSIAVLWNRRFSNYEMDLINELPNRLIEWGTGMYKSGLLPKGSMDLCFPNFDKDQEIREINYIDNNVSIIIQGIYDSQTVSIGTQQNSWILDEFNLPIRKELDNRTNFYESFVGNTEKIIPQDFSIMLSFSLPKNNDGGIEYLFYSNHIEIYFPDNTVPEIFIKIGDFSRTITITEQRNIHSLIVINNYIFNQITWAIDGSAYTSETGNFNYETQDLYFGAKENQYFFSGIMGEYNYVKNVVNYTDYLDYDKRVQRRKEYLICGDTVTCGEKVTCFDLFSQNLKCDENYPCTIPVYCGN